MITVRQYFGKFYTNPEVESYRKNAEKLLGKVGELLSLFGEERAITSGYRSLSYNKQVGGSLKSLHCRGLAIDLEDNDKRLGKFCLDNIEYLAQNGLYLESLTVTHKTEGKCWIHLQVEPPKSKNTVFIP